MNTTPVIENLATDVANAIDKLAKSMGLKPCKWCTAEPTNFAPAANGRMDERSLFCGNCGRFTFQYLDARKVMTSLARTWLGERQMFAVQWLSGLGEWQLCGHGGDHRFAIQAVILDGLMGGPDAVTVYCHGEMLVSISRYQIEESLSRAVNQAVLARLEEVPDFDLKSLHACPHCGAPGSEHVFRNFSEISRDADIYCGRCGEYVRMWNP